MYSFAQRPNAKVVDEPLYAHYLANINPTAVRPYREALLKTMNNNGDQVVEEFSTQWGNHDIILLKHMAKHFQKLSPASQEKLLGMHNVLLVRHPQECFSSYEESAGVSGAEVGLYDTGIYQQIELLEKLKKKGSRPIVVLYDDVSTDPEGTLRALCDALQLPFDKNMMQWTVGGRPEDGLWAPWWYKNTHSSTGWARSIGRNVKTMKMPKGFEKVKDEALAMYETLLAHRAVPKSQ